MKINLRYFEAIIKAIIVCITIVAALITWNIYRYTPHSKMEDLEYKQSILRGSKNITYTIEALRPIMGPEELTKFIHENDNNPTIYTPSKENLFKGIYRANLHIHTTNSDGIATVEQRMNMAQSYANKYIKDGKMVIAITDHNTILGAKAIVKVLEKNKGKYDKIKVVPGIEIFSEYHSDNKDIDPVSVHILTWCINPYDKFLNKEFYKKDLRDKYNKVYPERDFDWVISAMEKYGIVGVAHPARYTSYMEEKKYFYITEMLKRYKSLTTNTPFIEGYYQVYKESNMEQWKDEFNKFLEFINSESKKLNIYRTGSTDAHGLSLFNR